DTRAGAEWLWQPVLQRPGAAEPGRGDELSGLRLPAGATVESTACVRGAYWFRPSGLRTGHHRMHPNPGMGALHVVPLAPATSCRAAPLPTIAAAPRLRDRPRRVLLREPLRRK